MTDHTEREAQRVRDAYARRARLGLDSRYAYWEPANLFIYQSRERAFLKLLRAANFLPLKGRRILDVGCGDGSVLRDLLRYGAVEADLHGLDLLADRVERAQELLSAADIRRGDAQSLPYEDAGFDLVLGFTMLSSVVDQDARGRVAAEMTRVTRPGGRIVLYDFWLNPTNRDVRPLRRDDVHALFPDHQVVFEGTTLAPPLTRALVRLPGGWLACTAMEVIPFLRTHFLAAVTI
jgi:SAM-dependent methyltransferase